MRRGYIFAVLLIFSLFIPRAGFPGIAFAADRTGGWDISGEIRRLYKEAPSMSAYPNAAGVVWLSAFRYTLTPDGTMEKTHRFLMLLGQRGPGDRMTHVVPLPRGEGASFALAEASWYNPMTGMKEGTLSAKELDEGGFRYVEIEFPRETEGRVVAVEARETHPEKPYFDDVPLLAGAYPIWEQSVTVDVPDGMELFWQGEGVREPLRRKSVGRETITWSLMNQPVWRGAGVVSAKRPTVAFSLRRGSSASLRALQEAADKFQAPPPPLDLQIADGRDLAKVGEIVAAYLTKKTLNPPGLTPQLAKMRSGVPADGPWTEWEQTLIAGKWLEDMGYPSEVYWNQLFPVLEDGPDAQDIWAEPVLLFKARSARERDILFEAGRPVAFGRTAPSLYGKTVFRMDGNIVEKFNIPPGNAAEHTLGQTWRLTLDEMGIATGTLEIAVTGAWAETLPITEAIAERFTFNAPGLTLSPTSVTQTASGYRATFAVQSALGIVLGSDILMRVPSAVPRDIEEIAAAGERYSLRFPFTLEQSVKISTPRGYKVVGALPAEKQGDSKTAQEVSIFHWPKRGELEVTGKWTVRTQEIDETLSKVIQGQLNSYIRWSQTTLPLRKR